jgi:putative Mg2+ transporter-C (MgtC) family protein
MSLPLAATLDSMDVLARVLLAALLGALIGAERQWRSHAAGARTHALVASGAALFTLAGAYGFPDIARAESVDPMRVAAQVASGIGFVGAGAIIRDGLSVKGLTTAATLWASAAVGVAAGAAFYPGALVGFAVVLGSLVLLRHVYTALPWWRLGRAAAEKEIVVEYQRGHGTMAALFSALASANATVLTIGIHDEGERRQPGIRRTVVDVSTRDADALAAVAEGLSELPEVTGVEVVDRRSANGRRPGAGGEQPGGLMLVGEAAARGRD